ncbi:MAG TPA: hypothetical protein VFW13_16020 [Phenylobacterium sp.]|nr:hypothetical protein [Phenylobacterium sp.]
MDGVSSIQAGGFIGIDYAKRVADAARLRGGEGVEKTSSVQRGPAVVLGGALASVVGVSQVSATDPVGASTSVAPVPPVKPVVYRAGATVNLSV